MIDIKVVRAKRISEYIEEIYIIAGNRKDWWQDRKIWERVMFIRNLSYRG